MMKVLQLNIRGYNSSKRCLLQQVMMQVQEPTVLCLQETWLTGSKKMDLPGYDTYTANRLVKQGGGVAVCVAHSIPSKVIRSSPRPDLFECMVVKVFMDRTHTIIASIYVSNPSQEALHALDDFIHDLMTTYSRVLICGDFNCHHESWGSSHTTALGSTLRNTLLSENLRVLNDPSAPTWFSSSDERFEVLDLSLMSEQLAAATEPTWKVLDAAISDHAPILITMEHLVVPPYRKPPHVTWKRVDDWGTWTEACTEPVPSWLIERKGLDTDSDQDYTSFADLMVKLAKEHIGERQVSASDKLWWHDHPEVQHMIDESKRARKIYQRLRTTTSRKEANRAQRHCQKAIDKAKRQSWQKLCDKVAASPEPKSFWKLFKRSCGSNVKSIPALFTSDEKVATTAAEKANALNTAFCKVSEAPATRPSWAHMYLSQHAHDFDRAAEHERECDTEMHAVTHTELHEQMLVMAGKADSSPGHDRITPRMLLYGGPAVRDALLFLFNKSLSLGRLPEAWKLAKVHPIPKPDKDHSDVSNYRPISLLSVAGKLMERVIHHRLSQVLLQQEWLSPLQSGFRKHHSTMDHLTRLCNDVWGAFQNSERLMLVLLDLSKAYDTVWRDALRAQLHRIGVRGHMLWWLDDFLTERKQYTVVDNTSSYTCDIEEGVPQGSVLSPLLFLLMINASCDGVESVAALFADDIALWIRGQDEQAMQQQLTRDLRTVQDWSAHMGFSISAAKSSFSVFQKGRHTEHPPPTVQLGGRDLPFVECPKYLGMTLDPTLTFRPHLANITERCNQRLPLLTRLCYSNGGLTCPQTLTLYKVMIRSIMDYASPLWAGCQGGKLIEPLERIQRRALLAASGAYCTTSLDALQVDCGVFPLDLRFTENALKWRGKILRLQRTHPLREQCTSLLASTVYPNSFLGRTNAQSNIEGSLKIRESPHDVEPLPSTMRTITDQYGDGQCTFAVPPAVRALLDEYNMSLLTWRELEPFRHLLQVDSCPPLSKPRTAEAQAEAQAWAQRKVAEIKCSDPLGCICFTDASAQPPVGPASSAILFLPLVIEDEPEYMEEQHAAVTVSKHANNDTAELAAVAMACHQFGNYVQLKPEMKQLHIFSDSKYVESLFFSGSATASNKVSGDALRWLMLQLWFLFQVGCSVVFHWIPGHCGIEHNERADKLAKEELRSFLARPPADWRPLVRIPYGTHCSRVRHSVMMEWQRRWTAPMTDYPDGADLFAVRPLIKPLPQLWLGPRRVSNLLCRLRHGHCGLNSYLHRIDKSNSTCQQCGVEDETVEHYVLRCPAFDVQRGVLLQRVNIDDPTLSMVLATDAALASSDRQTAVSALHDFVISTRRFDAPDAE